jgi:hypothetical protein
MRYLSLLRERGSGGPTRDAPGASASPSGRMPGRFGQLIRADLVNWRWALSSKVPTSSSRALRGRRTLDRANRTDTCNKFLQFVDLITDGRPYSGRLELMTKLVALQLLSPFLEVLRHT